MAIDNIPEGFKRDANGNLIAINNIKEVDLQRDELVLDLVSRAKAMSGDLSRLRFDFLGEIGAFCELSAEKYGAKRGGEKGNVTLYSFDGKYKVVRANAELIDFDERLQSAQELIKDCMRDWSEGASDKLRTLVDAAFSLDDQGKLSSGRILALRRYKIDDPRWEQAMQAIGESVQIIGTKAYVRFFERGDDGGYKPISLNIATA